MKVYTASKTIHADKWRALRDSGVNVISTWIDEAGPGETKSFEDLWDRCVSEAGDCDVLLLYREHGEVLKGALVEAGAALACGIDVAFVGDGEGLSFINHRWVRRFPDLGAAVAAIRAGEIGLGGEP